MCIHDCSHSLAAPTTTDCQGIKCWLQVQKVRLADKSPHPPRVRRDALHTAINKPKPLATSSVAAISPVQRRPLPSEVSVDTRIRRLHLRKNAWWAWAPRHDPVDDHLYEWLRLDNEMQQQLSASLAGLEVPPTLEEKAPPKPAKCAIAAPYTSEPGKVLDMGSPSDAFGSGAAADVGVVAAMRQTSRAVSDRRPLQESPPSPAEREAAWPDRSRVRDCNCGSSGSSGCRVPVRPVVHADI